MITVAIGLVSVLYREPKLLKAGANPSTPQSAPSVSVLYREPKLLKVAHERLTDVPFEVSVLYREPKLLKVVGYQRCADRVVWFQCSTVSRNC